MARPRIERGDHGKIATKQVDGRWRGWARYRDDSGRLRMVERWADTKTKAEAAVRKALSDRTKEPSQGAGALLRPKSTVADAWLDYEGEVLANLAASTQRVYRTVWNRHVEPSLGGVAVGDVSEADAERLVNRVAKQSGAGAAKTTRTVLLGVMERARKARAVAVNPVRGSDRPTTARRPEAKRDKDRALSKEERSALLAQSGDTADLVAFMLGTGARLGEACAVTWQALDLDVGTVRIDATVTRDAHGRSVRTSGTKTAAGRRDVTLPRWLTERLVERSSYGGSEQRANARTGRVARAAVDPVLVFPSPRGGGVRDLRATDREIRRVLDAEGLSWATSHTFRRTVATMLLSGGMDPVQVARVLGHARPSITLDVYGKADRDVQAQTADLL